MFAYSVIIRVWGGKGAAVANLTVQLFCRTRDQFTPDMIGKNVAVFTAIETKKPKSQGGKNASDEQQTFITNVLKAGGIAAQVRSVDEANAVIAAGIV